MIRIDIVSDVVCPWCLIGKRRLERAIEIAQPGEVKITWRPFQLNADLPLEGVDRKKYLMEKYGAERTAQSRRNLTAIGDAEGIPFNFDGIKLTPHTLKAHRLLWLGEREGRQDPLVEALFAAHFIRGIDVGNPEALTGLAVEVGYEEGRIRDFLAGKEGELEVLAEEETARHAGVSGVPFFIFNGKYVLSGAQAPETFVELFKRLQTSMASA